jgi:hypothetical protein
MKNRGVRLGRRKTDYVAGEFTFITFEERNPSGDWRPFLPPGEVQFSSLVDYMDCVTRSIQNAIEIQEKFLTGEEAIDYSDRWTAKKSGTTHQGNYLYIVADSVRHDGLIPESDYPDLLSGTWDEQYADISAATAAVLDAKGQAWKEKWDFKYEFVPVTKESMMQHIKQAPLQVVIPGHAVVDFLCEADVLNYFDSYIPYQKKVAYPNILDVLKPLLTLKTMTKRFIINDHGKMGVMTLEGFTGTVQFCDKLADWATFKKILKVDDTTPIINLP